MSRQTELDSERFAIRFEIEMLRLGQGLKKLDDKMIRSMVDYRMQDYVDAITTGILPCRRSKDEMDNLRCILYALGQNRKLTVDETVKVLWREFRLRIDRKTVMAIRRELDEPRVEEPFETTFNENYYLIEKLNRLMRTYEKQPNLWYQGQIVIEIMITLRNINMSDEDRKKRIDFWTTRLIKIGNQLHKIQIERRNKNKEIKIPEYKKQSKLELRRYQKSLGELSSGKIVTKQAQEF